jgi:hypothetical protein
MTAVKVRNIVVGTWSAAFMTAFLMGVVLLVRSCVQAIM